MAQAERKLTISTIELRNTLPLGGLLIYLFCEFYDTFPHFKNFDLKLHKYCVLKVIRKFFLKHNKRFRWHLGN